MITNYTTRTLRTLQGSGTGLSEVLEVLDRIQTRGTALDRLFLSPQKIKVPTDMTNEKK